MAYSDIIKAINTYGGFYNQGKEYEVTNPYSSLAFQPSLENVFAENPMPVNPVTQASEMQDEMTGTDKTLMGLSQFGVGAGVGKGLAYAKGKAPEFLTKIFKGATPTSFNPAAALGVYAATRDQNPYEYSPLEFGGDIASGALLGTQIAPGIGTVLGATVGLVKGLVGQGQAKKKREKAETEFQKQLEERQDAINEAVIDQREQIANMNTALAYSDEASKYQNIYGGNLSFENGGILQAAGMPMDSIMNRQMFVESSFNPLAESNQGALGLTQITPLTFKDMQNRGFVPEGKTFEDLKTDTNLSMNLQNKYMDALLNRSWNQTGSEEVRVAKALAAYNLGPTKLVNRLNKIKDQGVDIYSGLSWVDKLPEETKNYVNKILGMGSEEFEQDYKKGFKEKGSKFNEGGKKNIVAEFTGNELIVNDQNEVEAGLKSGDFKRAAAPIRRAMQGGMITPGKETHVKNPMPVDADGNIFSKKGRLNFRVRAGAGVYDHATDQFKSNMDDKEIAMVAQKNINKWKKNNMA